MGWLSDVGQKVRNFWQSDKEHLALNMAKGTTQSGYPATGFDLLQAYGYDVISDFLKLEHDLLSRFVDYEEMDDSAELACISAESLIPVVEPFGKSELTCSSPRNMAFSGLEESMALSEISSRTVGQLFKDYEEGKTDGPFVFSFDHAKGRVVVAKAIGPKRTGEKTPVFRVTYEDYRRKRRWSIKCTTEHLFMLRDGSYLQAQQLRPGDRLMPCTLCKKGTGYLGVYEPFKQTSGGNSVYTDVHALVATAKLGREPSGAEQVHHTDRNRMNARPSNLEVLGYREHLKEHRDSVPDEARRVLAISKSVIKQWEDPEYRKRLSDAHLSRKPEWLDREKAGEHKHFQAQGKLSPEHRAAIAQGRTIPLAPDVIEASMRSSSSLNEASRKLGISWNTLVRRLDQLGMDKGILGSNVGGPQEGEVSYQNHRVVSVEYCGEEDVFDLEVPGYHNFAVGDPSGEGGFIFVHNSAIDIFADDASIPDSQLNRTIWVTSKNRDVETELNRLFHRTLRMDEEIWEIARTLIKYGNNFEELLVTPDGVQGLNFLPPPTVRRIEGPRGELFGFVQDFKGRFGYCLAFGSRVWTEKGLVEIQAFNEGKILSYVNSRPVLVPVKAKHSNGMKKVFRVKTRHRELFLTEDHPVLACVGSGPLEWTKVKDLKIVRTRRTSGRNDDINYYSSSKILIATRMPEGKIPSWAEVWGEKSYRPSENPRVADFVLPAEVTEDFCRLFGFLLGDGWVTEGSKGGMEVGFARGEYPEINDCYDNLLDSLGLDVHVYETTSRTFSKNFAQFLLAAGWINGFANKRIPPWMFALPEGHREALLRGFIDADGCDRAPDTDGTPRFSFGICNYDLARDFKNLIDSLGYTAGNVTHEHLDAGYTIKGKVVLSDSDVYRVQFSNRKFDTPFVTENVLSISYHEDAEVFDLEVDDEAHNFVSDGVVVHNSPQEFQQILASRSANLKNSRAPGPPGSGGFEKIAALEDWEVVHFRLRSKHRRSLYGYCYRKGSQVWTNTGLKPIEEIRVGDVLFTRHAGMMRLTEVVGHVHSGKKELIRVQTAHREISVTPEHRLLVDRGGKNNVWKQAGDLRIGERLVIATEWPELHSPPAFGIRLTRLTPEARYTLTSRGIAAIRSQTRRNKVSFKDDGVRAKTRDIGVTRGRLEELYEGRSDLSVEEARSVFESVGLPLFEGALALKREDSRLILPDFVTPQICRLWGFLAADGWLTDGQLYFARGLDEIQNKKYEDMLEAFGLPVGFQNGKEEAYVSSVAFVSLFRELGWTDGAHDKRVPGWIFGLAREYREEFLEGFADGDGHRRAGSTSCTIQLCNRLLVEDLKTLVDGLGWTCGLVHTYQSKESVIKAGTPRALWPGKFVEKDLVIKGGPQYSICWSKNSLACDRGWSSEPILSISKDGEDETFDLEVADASHSFVTNGVCGENSVLEPARWIWKRLMLLEDAALVYRLQRAPERYAFYVDTGDLPPPEALAYVNRVRQNFKKTKYVNPSTGKVDLKFNPLSQDEDFFIPVRKGAESNRVEVLGAPSWQHMEDIEYFRDKLFAALKIPKSYLGQEEGVNRATLGSQDVRFARTVLRIQRELRNGMGKVTRVHLAALNVDPKSVEYDIHMTVPSAIFELAQLEVRNARADLAGRMREFVSLRWMLNKIFGMSDSEIEEIIKERGDDVVREAEEQAKAQQAVNPPEAEAPPEGDDQETPPEGEGEPKESVTSPLIENFSRQKRFYSKTRRARGISEQELLVGDRGSERRAEDKLNKLLESDKKLAHRLDEVSSLLGELRAVAARK